ncbi:fimbria/pilus outer membrane usher protein, partial [Escherichia albertii]
DGRKKTFQVDTAYVPYLTRPGQIRYKLVSGRSRNYEHTTEGPVFAAGEASWGISNKWSLYGGGIVAGDYNALAVGLGRDLNEFGTVSADVTQSVARIPGEETKQGKSWRLSYSKRFDDVNADITFAGYRFSERNYMTMDQYLNARYRNDFTGREKELYTVTLNKNFEDWKTSVNLQYSHQTWWDRRTSDYYTLSVNRYFDAFGFKNISLGLSASRSKYQNRDNDSAFVRLSVPWGTGTASYSGSMSNDRYTNTVGYSDTLNKGLSSYSLNAGVSSGGSQPSQSQMSAYYNHSSPLANLSANFSAVESGYTSFGMSASGGATITAKGAALHAGGMNGGTRLLVDTDGVGGVPVDGGRVSTNRWGIGVVTDVSSYYRNTTSVDLNKLPEDMEATRSVVESVLTEGAIGYREFEVLKGSRLFAVLRLADNSHPPFGASVTNAKGRELGMVADSGLAWLSGVNPGETLNVGWDGRTQCVVDIPAKLDPAQQLLLPCRKAN